MHSRPTLGLVLVISANATGCYSTWDVTPGGVVILDGFREGQTRTLQSTEGEQVEFTSDSEMAFHGRDGVQAATKFRSIQVQDPILVGIESQRGAQVMVDLSRMNKVEVRSFSPAKTGLAVVGGLAGAGAIVGVTLYAVVASTVVAGRPLHVTGKAAPVRAPLVRGRRVANRGVRAQRMHELTRARIFAHWAQEASAECASIPAFLALARDLKWAGAPTSLVKAAIQAAREEATHTRLCTSLANEHTESPMATLTPETPDNTDRHVEALLERLALEAFWDGSVAEGTAAALAHRNAVVVKDAATRLALQTIARDEQHHADLAQGIVAYCLSAGGRRVRNALRESLERRRADEEAELEVHHSANESDIDEDTAQAYGLAGMTLARDARIETWEKSVAMGANV